MREYHNNDIWGRIHILVIIKATGYVKYKKGSDQWKMILKKVLDGC
jgi:hypothetical protein